MHTTMKKKIIIGCIGLVLTAVIGYSVYHQFFSRNRVTASSAENKPKNKNNTNTAAKDQEPSPKISIQKITEKPTKTTVLSGKIIQEVIEEEPVYHPKDLQEIKKQIYDINVEYIEDIELLDEVVQTGDNDVREFWGGDWRSADDWKSEENGFSLEQNTDGSYTFSPDEVTTRSYSFFETPQSFSYDQDRNEFNWEVDYYGKTITNKFRFINDETAVLMIISGRKVTTNIYRKNPPPEQDG